MKKLRNRLFLVNFLCESIIRKKIESIIDFFQTISIAASVWQMNAESQIKAEIQLAL